MKFHQLTLSVALTIATVAGLQAVTQAATKYDLMIKQAGRQTVQSQSNKPASQAESPAMQRAGQPFFSHPPQLTRAAATQLGADTPSTYEFTLTVPQDAGQPLKAVTIAQANNLETVKFDVSQSKAYVGERFASSSEIRLASVGGEQPTNPGEVTIVFDQPVQPGSTVTVALAAQKNPNWGGVYEFGVTAYPLGENGRGQFLGFGRINFYGNSN
jgi:hypothetical protein